MSDNTAKKEQSAIDRIREAGYKADEFVKKHAVGLVIALVLLLAVTYAMYSKGAKERIGKAIKGLKD